jgi:coenzyme F420-0:L-glutamate ligase/coenzyme F420-1:gamma-L-glutamate ligase
VAGAVQCSVTKRAHAMPDFPPDALTIHPVRGLPEVRPGDDLSRLLAEALRSGELEPRPGDVLIVTQKIVSKAEGARVRLDTIQPSPVATAWAAAWGHDPRHIELVLRESRRIVRMARGLIISETRHGFVCANAGIDRSNSGDPQTAILLPEDPDRSALRLREGLRAQTGVAPAVIVSDSFGRPWRQGLTQVALGVAGLLPLLDLRGEPDADGRRLHGTLIALADELAAAADLVCGKATRIPAALIRGWRPPHDKAGTGRDLLRPPEEDLFR